MQIFTIRKSLHKIKLWNNVRIDSAIYNSILTTRGIEYSDLYVYRPLITVNYLPHAYNFEYGENEDITNATILKFFNTQYINEYVKKMRPWYESEPITRDRAGFEELKDYDETNDIIVQRYNTDELDIIEANLAESDPANWQEIPLKEFSKLEEVEEKIYNIEIPVERITE